MRVWLHWHSLDVACSRPTQSSCLMSRKELSSPYPICHEGAPHKTTILFPRPKTAHQQQHRENQDSASRAVQVYIYTCFKLGVYTLDVIWAPLACLKELILTKTTQLASNESCIPPGDVPESLNRGTLRGLGLYSPTASFCNPYVSHSKNQNSSYKAYSNPLASIP